MPDINPLLRLYRLFGPLGQNIALKDACTPRQPARCGRFQVERLRSDGTHLLLSSPFLSCVSSVHIFRGRLSELRVRGRLSSSLTVKTSLTCESSDIGKHPSLRPRISRIISLIFHYLSETVDNMKKCVRRIPFLPTRKETLF